MKKRENRKSLVAVLMIFALTAILRTGAAFTVTAHAATLKENSWTWSEDSTIDKNLRIRDRVTVNADITLNIPKGLTLTVESGIDAHDRTMTVEGEGRLDIISTKDFGFFGNLVVNGADVSVSVKESENGVYGDLTVSGGSATVTGGERSLGQSYKDLAVSGTITALTVAVTVEGSYDNVRWSVIPSGTVSDNSYVKASTVHDFTYTAAGNTITATCSNDDCSLTDKKLTMTIKAPTLTTYGPVPKRRS